MDPSLRTIRRQLKLDLESTGPRVLRVFIALVVALVPLLASKSGVSETFEPHLLRPWFALRGKREVPKTVSIVRLDKPAYDKIGLSPGELFPRNHVADALEKITAAGAKLIVIDAVAQRPGNDPEVDIRLAEALKNTPTVIGRSTETIIETDIDGKRVQRRVQNKPISLFAENAKAVIPMEVRLTNGVVEQIALTNARDVFSNVRVPLLQALRDFVNPQLKEPGGFDFINFYGGPSSIPNLSIGELIGENSRVREEFFRDRVVLIGAFSESGTGAEAGKDSFLTPVSREWMFGVEIHANIAANLLDGSWLRRINNPQHEAMALGIATFLVSYVLLSLSMLSGFFVALLAVLSSFGISYYAFVHWYYFLPALIFSISVLSLVVLRWAVVAFRVSRLK